MISTTKTAVQLAQESAAKTRVLAAMSAIYDADLVHSVLVIDVRAGTVTAVESKPDTAETDK